MIGSLCRRFCGALSGQVDATDVYTKVWEKNGEKLIRAACSVYNDRNYIEYGNAREVTNHSNSYFVVRDDQFDDACRTRLNSIVGDGHLNLVLDINQSFLNEERELVMSKHAFPSCEFSLYLINTEANINTVGDNFAYGCTSLETIIVGSEEQIDMLSSKMQPDIVNQVTFVISPRRLEEGEF